MTLLAEQPSTLSLSAYGQARSTIQGSPLSSDELQKLDAYWRACKYQALGMIYLLDNPLLKEPLKPEHIKNRLLGHWGSSPGLAFMYMHLNRLINNEIDRFSLAIDAIDRVPKLQNIGGHAKEKFRNNQIACRAYAYQHGIDSRDITGWRWPQ